MRKLFVILLTVCLLTGCSSKKKAQEPPADHVVVMDTLSLTIPAEFTAVTVDNPYQKFMYQKGTMFVNGYSESIADLLKVFNSETITLGSYIQSFESNMIEQGILANSCTNCENNIWHMEYTSQVEGKEYTFLYVFYETDVSFWRVQGCCPTEEFEENREFLWNILTAVK